MLLCGWCNKWIKDRINLQRQPLLSTVRSNASQKARIRHTTSHYVTVCHITSQHDTEHSFLSNVGGAVASKRSKLKFLGPEKIGRTEDKQKFEFLILWLFKKPFETKPNFWSKFISVAFLSKCFNNTSLWNIMWQKWPFPLVTHSFSVFCFLMHAWPAVVGGRKERLQLKKALKRWACFTHWAMAN